MSAILRKLVSKIDEKRRSTPTTTSTVCCRASSTTVRTWCPGTSSSSRTGHQRTQLGWHRTGSLSTVRSSSRKMNGRRTLPISIRWTTTFGVPCCRSTRSTTPNRQLQTSWKQSFRQSGMSCHNSQLKRQSSHSESDCSFVSKLKGVTLSTFCNHLIHQLKSYHNHKNSRFHG